MWAEIVPTKTFLTLNLFDYARNTGFLDVQKFDFKQKVDFEIPVSGTSEF